MLIKTLLAVLANRALPDRRGLLVGEVVTGHHWRLPGKIKNLGLFSPKKYVSRVRGLTKKEESSTVGLLVCLRARVCVVQRVWVLLCRCIVTHGWVCLG
jgi:hypothetical protein